MIRLISRTVPVDGHADAERLTAYIARVSSSNQENPDYEKLLRYCIKHAHWSVFEHCHLTFEIDGESRATTRQVLRHRSFTFQEFSQRYAPALLEPVLNPPRAQDTKNRQASHDTLDDETKKWYREAQEYIWHFAAQYYQGALARGIAKECARDLLPEGLTPTRMYVTGNLRSWLHYCDLRTGNGTQLEHVRIASAIREILKDEIPAIAKAMWPHE